MINKLKELVKNNDEQGLVNFIRHEAGSFIPHVFRCTAGGGFLLQQIPEEYSKLLLYLNSKNFKRYLEIGIGSGSGPYIFQSLFNFDKVHLVDNLEYTKINRGLTEDYVINRMNQVAELTKDFQFYPVPSDEYFEKYSDGQTFDLIFIDGNHEYEFVKRDFENALPLLEKGGEIIFHDIANTEVGVKRLWEEVKNENRVEFVESNNCGIGVWRRD